MLGRYVFKILLPIIVCQLIAIANANSTEGSTQSLKKGLYTGIYIDSLLSMQEDQDGKESVLTSLIESTDDRETLANLYCRRGRLRITHTHLPKGVKDMQACIDILAASPNQNTKEIKVIEQVLTSSKKKLHRTQLMANDKQEKLLIRFTALWKLGERKQAVALVKAQATPESFSTMSTNRMVKAGYLCKGSGPNGPEKSYRTKQTGSFWWCDELFEN